MNTKKKLGLTLIIVLVIGFCWPQDFKMPVKGATSADYHSGSFWYYPWGKSVTHKGVDIFAKKGTDLYSSTQGLVVYKGYLAMGGHVVLVLGPKWRLHYYAHLDETRVSVFDFVHHQKAIGTVGDSGNAKGKSPHLHYSIVSIFPNPWRIDSSRQGWKKMFFLNPIDYLKEK